MSSRNGKTFRTDARRNLAAAASVLGHAPPQSTMPHLQRLFLCMAFAVAAAAPPVRASIERLDLPTMVAKADGAVEGVITRRRVVRIDDVKDGPELYFTLITIEGRSLADGAPLTVEVVHAGGFVDARHGVFNSEAPAADDTRIGNRVVAFYKRSANVGGGLAGNALYAAHGGIYRTFQAAKGVIVQGRGAGYAVNGNVELATLRARVTELARAARPGEVRK